MEEEFIEIDLGIDGKPIAQKHNKVALIDADTLAYTACLNTEVQECFLPRDMYSDEEWEELISHENYDESNQCIWTNNLELAYSKAVEKLGKIFEKTGCQTCELHFTDGRENFRYQVKTNYKGNRTNFRSPAGLKELKEMLLANYSGTISTMWEADDIWVYKLKQDFKLRESEKVELQLLSNTPENWDQKTEHGYCGIPIYEQYANMMKRCYSLGDINSIQYKEKGIKVYSIWAKSPIEYINWAMANGWYKGCSIDRIDNDGHYIPSNIQFIPNDLNKKKQNLCDNTRDYIPFSIRYQCKVFIEAGKTMKEAISLLRLDYSENLRSKLGKAIKELTANTEAQHIVNLLNYPGVKFKLNNIYYISRNSKAEFYRDYIGVAVDKDCLNSIYTSTICKLFNYYESSKYNIDMKWLEVDERTTMKWAYVQCLIGDTTDNIEGIKGIGPKKAEKILAGCQTHADYWYAVANEFEEAGKGLMDAIETMRLVNMYQLVQDGENYTIKLWKPEDMR